MDSFLATLSLGVRIRMTKPLRTHAGLCRRWIDLRAAFGADAGGVGGEVVIAGGAVAQTTAAGATQALDRVQPPRGKRQPEAAKSERNPPAGADYGVDRVRMCTCEGDEGGHVKGRTIFRTPS